MAQEGHCCTLEHILYYVGLTEKLRCDDESCHSSADFKLQSLAFVSDLASGANSLLSTSPRSLKPHLSPGPPTMAPPFAMMMSNILSPGNRNPFGGVRPPSPTPPPHSPQKGSSPSPGRGSRPLSSPAKLARIATTQGQIKCNCGSVFPNIDILERHMLASHPENTNLVSFLPVAIGQRPRNC